MTEPVLEALAQVREVRRRVLERQPFDGYSARARIAGGLIVLGGTLVIGSSYFPHIPLAHLGGWMVVALAAAAVNFGAVAHWFYRDPDVGREPGRLRPVLEGLPPLLAGAALTAGLAMHGSWDLLIGAWIALYGLVNFYSHPFLPRAMRLLGIFYLACGILLLIHPGIDFMKPWPMALVFGVGESAGGWILHRQRVSRGICLDSLAVRAGRNRI